ncbi:hypothetical protein DO70_1466 [Burkholderia pseudomallei]|nr:hypothetical protein DO70_1466 [Burkholderia pseudomallei]
MVGGATIGFGNGIGIAFLKSIEEACDPCSDNVICVTAPWVLICWEWLLVTIREPSATI